MNSSSFTCNAQQQLTHSLKCSRFISAMLHQYTILRSSNLCVLVPSVQAKTRSKSKDPGMDTSRVFGPGLLASLFTITAEISIKDKQDVFLFLIDPMSIDSEFYSLIFPKLEVQKNICYLFEVTSGL